MFRENKAHLQRPMFSILNELPGKQQEILLNSWAGTFRRDLFERIDERPFAVLYAEEDSRPNTPVNVLVGLEVLKIGRDWTDEEMMEAFSFNLQVRYALGYEELSIAPFTLRTVSNFRRRLGEHEKKSGENLMATVFSQITDAQLETYGLLTSDMRMDSSQIASYIQQFTRLHLLAEVVQRLWRSLGEEDQDGYAALFGPYVQGKAKHFMYRLRQGEYKRELNKIGEAMAQMVEALAPGYGETEAYQMLVRVFGEHFVWTPQEQRLKEPDELEATSLQSPDDPEATFRRKGGESYRGYVTNITETCHPQNDLQLIVHVQTEPNVTDDGEMLREALPELVERMAVETLYTDGGYNGPETDKVLDAHGVELVQTAIRGGKPDPEMLGLTHFQFELDPSGAPVSAICPAGQRIPIEAGRTEERFIGRPDPARCRGCLLLERCPARPATHKQRPVLYLHERQVRTAIQRQEIAARLQLDGNLRAAVEATVRSVKHPFRQGKLLVRGKFRVACQILSSAFMVNIRRIHAYRVRTAQPPKPAIACAQHSASGSQNRATIAVATQKSFSRATFVQKFGQFRLGLTSRLSILIQPALLSSSSAHRLSSVP